MAVCSQQEDSAVKRYIAVAGAGLAAIQFRAGGRFGWVAEKLERKIFQWNRAMV